MTGPPSWNFTAKAQMAHIGEDAIKAKVDRTMSHPRLTLRDTHDLCAFMAGSSGRSGVLSFSGVLMTVAWDCLLCINVFNTIVFIGLPHREPCSLSMFKITAVYLTLFLPICYIAGLLISVISF